MTIMFFIILKFQWFPASEASISIISHLFNNSLKCNDVIFLPFLPFSPSHVLFLQALFTSLYSLQNLCHFLLLLHIHNYAYKYGLLNPFSVAHVYMISDDHWYWKTTWGLTPEEASQR